MKRGFLACLAIIMIGSPPPAAASERDAPIAAAANSDEANLWADAARAEEAVRQSAALEHDPALNAYVRTVLCRTTSAHCQNLRLYIVVAPNFGARTLPNGAIEIGSGMLLRAANEAQLAFILGREVAHYTERHALHAMRAERGRSNAGLAIGAAASVFGAYYASDLIDLGLAGALRGLALDRERDADQLGVTRMHDAGYDGAEAFALSYALFSESRAGRRRSPSRRATTEIDRAAPTTRARLRALQALASDRPASNAASAQAYRARIRPFLVSWLEQDLRRRDYDASLFVLNRLASIPADTGVVQYFRGEAFRLRRDDGDLERAGAAYAEALQNPDAPLEAWRQLGEVEARLGRIDEAQRALRNYLVQAPNAEDRALIEARLDELRAR